MRFEVNRPEQHIRPALYSMSAFNNIRNLTNVLPSQVATDHQQVISTATSSSPLCHLGETNNIEVEECCICLYALAPFQALFVAPCSHSYHFKCIRPLFDSYPGFQCPICRTYSDLDASVSIEAEEVIERFGLRKSSVSNCGESLVIGRSENSGQATDSVDESMNEKESKNYIQTEPPTSSLTVQPTNVALSSIIPPAPELPLSTTLVACTTSLSGIISSPTFPPFNSRSSLERGTFTESYVDLQRSLTFTVIVFIVPRDLLNKNAGDHRSSTCSNDDNVMTTSGYQQTLQQYEHSNPASSSRNSNNLVEKIKMAFSNERRKSASKKRMNSNSDTSSDEDLVENFFDMPCSSTSSPPSSPRNNTGLTLQPILSRKSTQYNSLAEIIEEPITTTTVTNSNF